MGSNDPDKRHTGISFTEYFMITKNVDLLQTKGYAKAKDLTGDDARKWLRRMVMGQLRTEPNVICREKEHSRLTSDLNPSQIEFLRLAYKTDFEGLESFHFSIPFPGDMPRDPEIETHRRKRIRAPDIIFPEDIKALAEKVQNVSNLHVRLDNGKSTPSQLISFLGSSFIRKGDEGDHKESAEKSSRNFANLTHLDLTLYYPVWSEELIDILNGLPALKTIGVNRYSPSPVFEKIFTTVRKLTFFQGYASLDAGLIPRLDTIQTLDITGSEFTMEEYEKIFALPSLTSLTVGNHSLRNRNIDPKQFALSICKIGKHVRKLFLGNWYDSVEGIFPICAQMPQLRSFKHNFGLWNYPSTADLASFSNTQVEEIDLSALTYQADARALRSTTLKTLIIRAHDLPEEVINDIPRNCPNLTCFEITGRREFLIL